MASATDLVGILQPEKVTEDRVAFARERGGRLLRDFRLRFGLDQVTDVGGLHRQRAGALQPHGGDHLGILQPQSAPDAARACHFLLNPLCKKVSETIQEQALFPGPLLAEKAAVCRRLVHVGQVQPGSIQVAMSLAGDGSAQLNR